MDCHVLKLVLIPSRHRVLQPSKSSRDAPSDLSEQSIIDLWRSKSLWLVFFSTSHKQCVLTTHLYMLDHSIKYTANKYVSMSLAKRVFQWNSIDLETWWFIRNSISFVTQSHLIFKSLIWITNFFSLLETGSCSEFFMKMNVLKMQSSKIDG